MGASWIGTRGISTAVRLLLDEDVPQPLAEHLRARGIDAVHVNEIRHELQPADPDATIPDERICELAAETPTVIVTLNVRDYADPAFVRQHLVERNRVSVVIVRTKLQTRTRPKHIHDIVHRHAHKLPSLYDASAPTVTSLHATSIRTTRAEAVSAAALGDD